MAPEIRNLDALQAAGAGELRYDWSVSGGAVISREAPGKLILERSQCGGTIAVALALDNGGAAATASTSIRVTEPGSTARSPRMEKRRPVTPDTYRSIGPLNQFQSNATARAATSSG